MRDPHDDTNFVRISGLTSGDARVLLDGKSLHQDVHCQFLTPTMTTSGLCVRCEVCASADDIAVLASLLCGPPQPIEVEGCLVRDDGWRIKIVCRQVLFGNHGWRIGNEVHTLPAKLP